MGRSISQLFVRVAVAFLVPAAAARAGGIAEQPQQSASVTIRGCLRGDALTTLKSDRSDDPSGRYRLAGSPRFLELLKQHTSHTEEATGMLRPSNASDSANSTAKPGDKAGAKKPPLSKPARQVIEVTAMTHVSAKCS